MAKLAEALERVINGRYPLVYLQTPEEERVLAAMRAAAPQAFPAAASVKTWSCVSGLEGAPGVDVVATREPVAALRAMGSAAEGGFYVFRDLSEFLRQPEVLRALRELYQTLAEKSDRMLVITSPLLVLPPLLEKEVYLVVVDPPGEDELLAEALRVQATLGVPPFAPELHSDLAMALKGLTLREVGHLIQRVVKTGALARASLLEEIFIEKEMIVRKSGFLEFVPPRYSLADIGGLELLKDWLEKRQHLFTRDALASGMPIPKGILIMGVSGCGKSLTAKVVSSLWHVPLFRLDMNLVFSGLYGTPEAAFEHAMRTVEAVAPVVLWVDEIENGLASFAGGGGQQHIFSAFLTWMQEKPPLVFIAATANRIQDLPAEILRKGRFDQVFFVDLPSEEERRQILSIHLRRNGIDPTTLNIDYLVMDTEGWNGAEIEQAVVSARIDALAANRTLETKDVSRTVASMVPLSETMREQIKSLRDWAYKRATPAGKAKKK